MTQQEIEDAALGQFVVLERQKAVTDYKARLLERLIHLDKDHFEDDLRYWQGWNESLDWVKQLVEELS